MPRIPLRIHDDREKEREEYYRKYTNKKNKSTRGIVFIDFDITNELILPEDIGSTYVDSDRGSG